MVGAASKWALKVSLVAALVGAFLGAGYDIVWPSYFLGLTVMIAIGVVNAVWQK